MASGDRIELLTAGTFETAMDAQEEILNNISTKVNTINTNVEQSLLDISTAYTNVSKDISTVYQTDATNYSVLSDLSTKMGSSNNTGGTATAGTVMAKLNALITAVNTIQSSSSNSLYSNVFIPSETNLLKTVLNTKTTVSSLTHVGTFVSKYSGAICIKATGYSAITSSTYPCRVYAYANITGGSILAYPSMPQTSMSENYSYNGDDVEAIRIESTTSSTYTGYLRVRAGDIVSIALQGYTNNACTCTNVSIYGSIISTY